MRIHKLFITVPLLASMILLSSCKDYVGREKSHPFFIKAGACKSAGNYKEAVQYFEEFLNVCPRSPVTHYELASLYNDNLDDPYKAIYHFQRYLELDRNSADADNVTKFIEISKRKIFDRLSRQFESAETAKAYADAAKAKNLLDKYVEYSGKLREQNGKLREQNAAMRDRIAKFGRDSSKFKETVQALQKQVDKDPEEPKNADSKPVPQDVSSGQPSKEDWEKAQIAASSPGSTAGSADQAKSGIKAPAPVPAEKTQKANAKTHKVVKGDTLYNLAKTYYGSSRHWTVLRDANKGKLGRNDSLRIGQTLDVPELPAGVKK